MYQHFMLNINKKMPHYVLMKKNGFVWFFFEIKNNKSAAGMQHTPPQDTTFQNQLLYPV